jgi:hypothetical protein
MSEWTSVALGSSGVKLIHREECRPVLLCARVGEDPAKVSKDFLDNCKCADTTLHTVLLFAGLEPRKEYLFDEPAPLKIELQGRGKR